MDGTRGPGAGGAVARPDTTAEGGCWPTETQALLLRAALLTGPDAVADFRRWKARVDPERLDPGSARLLPLLGRNLHLQGVRDPLIDRAREARRAVWSQNTRRLSQLAPLLHALHEAGVETLVLKGVAVVAQYYDDAGLRPMGDADVLVRTDRAPAAIAVLTRLGWAPESPAHAVHARRVTHAQPFRHGAGREIDLHWHVFFECCEPDADADLWAGSAPAAIRGLPTRVLAPADQLLHVVVHGVRWNAVPPLRWVPDALMILRARPDLDWTRLLAQTRARAFGLPVRHALAYLRERLEAPIPPEVLARLDEAPVSRLERIEYRAKTRPPGFWSSLPLLLCHHARLTRGLGTGRRIAGFPSYLREAYGLARPGELPRAIGSKLVRQLRARRA